MTAKFYTGPFDALNNFSAHAVEYNGVLYPTAEHAFQVTKSIDQDAKKAILAARSPLVAKTLSNGQYGAFRDPEWGDKKIGIMKDILTAKYEQHEEVRSVLDSTTGSTIEEDSPTDYFWGIGKDGLGKNHLGQIWMQIRDGQ